MKNSLGIWLIAAVAVTLGGLAAGYWHFSSILPDVQKASLVALEQETEPAMSAPMVEGEQSAAEPALAEALAAVSDAPLKPSFELVRVEADGSAVIAGVAPADSELTLFSGGDILARETVGASGEFAFVLIDPLAAGEHQLRLEAEIAGGERFASRESALVSVPERGQDGDLLVMLAEPDAPTRIVTAPPLATAAVAEAAPISEEGLLTPVAQSPVEPAQSVPRADPGNPSQLAVRAVEIEDDNLYVAGISRPGSTVRLYLDDEFVGETKAGEGEEFLASLRADVPVGSHIVRADEVARDGTVSARVEVPFERPEGQRIAAVVDPRAPQGAESLEPVEGRVIIRRGDTLWRISRETYGEGRRYTVIYLANGDQIRNPNLIYPGQVFRLPETGG